MSFREGDNNSTYSKTTARQTEQRAARGGGLNTTMNSDDLPGSASMLGGRGSAKRREKQGSNFQIMPKMRFSAKPKLLVRDSKQMLLNDYPQYFSRGDCDSKFKNFGHGDPMQRIRGKFGIGGWDKAGFSGTLGRGVG